ncbi:MAG: sulfotransferase [Rhodospirillales bacterium]|nr:sulfotransferase [Rhodospirillales bacterium]
MSSVPIYTDWLGSLLEKAPNILIGIGNLETKLLHYDIIDLKIQRPVFITGLARAGSTITLEILGSHPDCTSYQYGDYPFIHCQYFWNTARKFFPSPQDKIERAHKDRLRINMQSPEALDEILWMSFFETLHDPAADNILNATTNNPAFETFYKNALLKLLAARSANRIALKNNYHASRLLYLHKLFPDARFVIPLRQPETHIYSLIKQHRLLSESQKDDPRGRRYMRRHGHFEFGLDFRPTNFNDPQTTAQIMSAWQDGDLVTAYALYWKACYSYIYETLQNHPALKDNCLILKYEDFCTAPESHIQAMLAHCGLEDTGISAIWKDKISAPTYYKCDFTPEEQQKIKDLTENAYQKF